MSPACPVSHGTPRGAGLADVIVVGAGPAGAVTALELARRGFDVRLVDRATFPRRKPCGECLSPRATRVLAELGVLPDIDAAGPARLAGWRIVAPGGNAFEARFDDVTCEPDLNRALAIGRDRLDTVLVEAAVRAGVRLEFGTRVLDLTPGVPGVVALGPTGRFEARARLVVGADGLRSIVARRIGAPARPPRLRKLSLTAHCLDIEPDTHGLGEMHVADGLCAGIAPVDVTARTHNVSLVVDADRYGRYVATAPVAFFRDALEAFPRLCKRTRRARFVESHARTRTGPLLASGPFDLPTRRITIPGYALVGDAAGYYDPFTGQGIYQALTAGRLLAEAAAHALRRDFSPPCLVSYERNQRRLVRGSRVLQRIIEAVVRRPALADRAIARLARRPATGRALLAATGDLQPAFEALSPAVLLGFLAPWTTEAPGA